jgi:glutamate synthase (NADPH/NADH) small chain
MPLQSILSPEVLAANMADIKPPYREHEALIEASRCLFCFDAPCIMACPTGIDVPSFIRKISLGNPVGAARTILSANILGASCARVCPTQVLCEGACVMQDREGNPIKIGRLQRYATDYVEERGLSVLAPPRPGNGRKVAVVGAGPAGLGCAAELAQLGYAVVVLERQKRAGGLNTHGIAYYKMKPEVSLAEVERVKSLGVEIRCGVEVGRDVPVDALQREFDAVFVGIGLGDGNRLGVPGEDLPEVIDALAFIRTIHTRALNQVPVGRRVAVIGCGNTAIDAATQALRLGAERAAVIYRRGEADMSAYRFEYELAQNDGAQFHFRTVPVEVVSEGGHVAGLKLARTRIVSGRKVEPEPGSEFFEAFDMVLKAVGEEKQAELLSRLFPGLALDGRGAVAHDPITGATNLPGIFCGGDCANGGREVVNAVGEGKKAARGIHACLARQQVDGPVQPSRLGAPDGAAGSGLLRPIRAHELEAALKDGKR